jgi:amino-acid N-acetyltransferase
VNFSVAGPELREQARQLLARCALPTADLETAPMELIVAIDEDAIAGCAGLEVAGDVGLLRSLAVDERLRKQGVGRQLYERVLERSRERKLSGLFLLTTTARGYFARLGWTELARDRVPAGIAATGEFRSLCPSTATVMALQLNAPHARASS